MQLTRPTPGRAQRRTVQALLLAGALAAGFGAWAAVADLEAVPLLAQAPATAAKAAADMPAAHAAAMAPAVAAAPAMAATPAADATPAALAEQPTPAPLAASALPSKPAATVKATQAAPRAARPMAAQAAEAAPAAAPAEPVQRAQPPAADVTPPYPDSVSDRVARLKATPLPTNAWRVESDTIMSMRFQPDGEGKKPLMALPTPELAARQMGPAKDGSPRYKVAMAHSMLSAGKTRTSNFAIAVAPSENATVTVNEGGRLCKFTLKVNPRGDDTVALDMPVECDDGQHHPRLVTRLGEPATVEFGSTDGVVQRFTLVVTAPST